MEETTDRIAIGEVGIAHLKTAAQWARFLAIFQFVLLGIGIICMIFALLAMIVAGASFSEMAGASELPSGFFVWYFAFILVMIVPYIFIAYRLLNFGTGTLQAIRARDEAVMTDAFADLGKYFRLTGIVMIATIVLSVLMGIVLGVMAAAMQAGF